MPTWLSPATVDISLYTATINLSVALVLSCSAAMLYRWLGNGPSYSFSFFVTLVVTPIVVAMVIMAIGGNIAASLGLVGALSIVRFRTVIKDTRDTAYLLLMIGIGLCCGAGALALAMLGTAFVAVVLIGVHVHSIRSGQPNEFILMFRHHGDTTINDAESELNSMVDWRKLHSASDLGDDDGFEYTYRIKLSAQVSPERAMISLKNVDGVYDVSLIRPEGQLPV